jgi:hypothetical protein
MHKFKILFLLTPILCEVTIAFAQESKVVIPSFNDKYSKYVAQLESGDLNLNYTDFRNSFLDSKLFWKKSPAYDSLKKLVYSEMDKKNYNEIVRLTKDMLSIDYTSMFAHECLQQTYKNLGDSVNQKKYHDILFGLFDSIIKSGDGKTCKSGWHVTQIEEEYFILDALGFKLQSQATTNGGRNACDKMVVKSDEGESTYYFEANKVFEMEKKLFER